MAEQKELAKLYHETINSLQNHIMSELRVQNLEAKKDFHPKPETDNEKQEEKAAIDQLNIKLHEIYVRNIDGNSDESDQSQLLEDGVEGRLLRRAWSEGLDVHPNYGLMSVWMKTLFFGDYGTFLVSLERCSEEGAKKLIENANEHNFHFSCHHWCPQP